MLLMFCFIMGYVYIHAVISTNRLTCLLCGFLLLIVILYSFNLDVFVFVLAFILKVV